MASEPHLNIRFLTNYMKCNFKCPYCIVGSMKNDPNYALFDEAALARITDNIIKIQGRINIRLGVLGEFFLSQALLDAARKLSNAPNVLSVNLITNLSFPYKTYLRKLEGCDASKTALVASFHPTEIRDFNVWFDTALRLNKLLDFAVVFVGYPPLLPAIAKLVAAFTEQGVHTFVQGFVGAFEGRNYPDSYTEHEKALLRSISSSRHDYEYFVEKRRPGLCNAGYKSLFVDLTGNVRPCGMGKRAEHLGNLLQSPELRLFDGPRPCPRSSCLCDTENINAVSFEERYEHTGLNQHRFKYRFAELAKVNPEYDEWSIKYP